MRYVVERDRVEYSINTEPVNSEQHNGYEYSWFWIYLVHVVNRKMLLMILLPSHRGRLYKMIHRQLEKYIAHFGTNEDRLYQNSSDDTS